MSDRLLVFCTARAEIVSGAVQAILENPSEQTVIYMGPTDSPFANVAKQFISWGSGPFNFWKALRLQFSLGKLKSQTVILPLNRMDGQGYFSLRLFARWISLDRTLEVTPDETIRPVNMRRFSDTYHIEERFHQFLTNLFYLFKPLFKLWLRPQQITRLAHTKITQMSHTSLRDFESTEIPDVSIIIRSYNEERFIAETLGRIYQQEGVSLEVILIDSESTDATVEIARTFPTRLVKIEKETFGYGAALNLGARLAKGRYLVNLSAHAVPAHTQWLKELIAPLSDPRVAGVHGSEKPMEGHCGYLERKILIDSFPDIPLNRTDNFFFSNANAAMTKEIVLKNPFDESVSWAEDRLWAKQMQELGFKTVYCPKARVYHSHNLSAKQNFERCYKFFVMQFDRLYENQAGEIRNTFRNSLSGRVLEFRRFLSDQKWMPAFQSFIYAPFCEFINYLGCEFAWDRWNSYQHPQAIEKNPPITHPKNHARL